MYRCDYCEGIVEAKCISIQFQRYRHTNHSEPVTIVKMIHFTPERSSLPVMWSLDIKTELSLIYRPRSTLIDWGLVTPIWWKNYCHHWFRYWLVIILVPAIAWTNDDIHVLSIGTLEKNLCEIILQIQIVCVVKICSKMLSAKQWPFCSGLGVLTHNQISHLLSF